MAITAKRWDSITKYLFICSLILLIRTISKTVPKMNIGFYGLLKFVDKGGSINMELEAVIRWIFIWNVNCIMFDAFD